MDKPKAPRDTAAADLGAANDPQVDALQTCFNALKPLDAEARRRALDYLNRRFADE